MGVDILDLVPPHLNPPPPWGEEVFFGSIGVIKYVRSVLQIVLRNGIDKL